MCPEHDIVDPVRFVAIEPFGLAEVGAEVAPERVGAGCRSRSARSRSWSLTASSNEGSPELNQPSPRVAARRSARSELPPSTSGIATGRGVTCTGSN